MSAAARTILSGPLRAGLAALLLAGAGLPAAAQVPPPSRPGATLREDAPPPASAYAATVPEAARAREAGEAGRGAWPAPPPRRPGAREPAAPPPLTALDRELDPADLPAATLTPPGPLPPPARGCPPALVSTLEEAIAAAPDAAPPAADPEAAGPAAQAPTPAQAPPGAAAPAEPLPPPSLAADRGSALAAAASVLPPSRPAAAPRPAGRAVAIALPDPRQPRGPQGEPQSGLQGGPRGGPQGGPRGAPGAAAGGLCGDPRLLGRVQAPIDGPGGCGIAAPVEVTHVHGVALTPPAVVNCRTARIFADWLERGPMREAPRTLGARISKVRVAASYACRPRNNRPGARMSEHGLGNAVDVGAFQLSDGREIGPLRSWGKGEAGRFLKAAWTSACGPFSTVLGPGSDGHHMDHLHFDSARRREAYCR
ncbi:MAG: extensin-like domain-containing protein [Albimonas sp.]|uniref:extensin-like domain-containing protein n=1 Tax=Albimonas sp. TaxID=1872425 RepID=UPI004057843F